MNSTFLHHLCLLSPHLPLARREKIDSKHKYGPRLNSPFSHWFRTNSPPTDSVCKHNEKNAKPMSDFVCRHNIFRATHGSMLVWISLMRKVSQWRAGHCSRDSPWSWDQGFNGDKPVVCWSYCPGVLRVMCDQMVPCEQSRMKPQPWAWGIVWWWGWRTGPLEAQGQVKYVDKHILITGVYQ